MGGNLPTQKVPPEVSSGGGGVSAAGIDCYIKKPFNDLRYQASECILSGFLP